ncbi:class I SAM-dependent methyltransferase [Nocardioides sp. L-11A]|uniref:class I SAM-dependent methyltransferase n=1 Tax=Nocardioides sp. L-11A TaxID=3043848 RepID=UPI002499EC9B|nr:methyltransferase domain-containing protein [Nocardioides sp. L-11A]
MWHARPVRAFEELVAEAEQADVSGWGFGWLDGRASEERPPWGYSRLLAERLAGVGDHGAALDLDTGGGEVLAEAPVLPGRMVVTEGWAPNAERARRLLGPRGAEVVEVSGGRPLPFPDASFELVTARHPVAPDWAEIARVLRPGGRYLAQHVGPASAFELIEWFLGPLPEERRARDPEDERSAAERAGLTVVDLRTARCRMELYDIGAVVWLLRKCVWWVPDFTVERYRDRLQALDEQLRAGRPFVAHATRHLVEARR